MNIQGVNGGSPVRPVQGQAAPRPAEKAAPQAPADTVEISPAARYASRLAEVPAVRTELIQRIRSEIQAGTYETGEKLDVALGKLLQELDI